MKATLKTLTPVHIGSGQTLNKNIDFAQEGNQIGFFDLDKIVQLIGIENINQLTSTIEQSKPMLDFLRNGIKLKNPLNEFCERISPVKSITTTTTQLKEHYRTTLKGVCIPGSSLKGSVKTAIWDNLADDNILRTLSSDNLKNNRGKWSDSYLDKKLFGNTANDKSTRFIKIGDIHFPEVQTEIHETIIINQHFNNWTKKEGSSFLIECIPANQKAEFDMKIDDTLLAKNKENYPLIFTDTKTEYLKNSTGLAKLVNAYTVAILEWEIRDLEDRNFGNTEVGNEMLDKYDAIAQMIDKLPDNEFILRVGANSGWRFMTGGWITKPAIEISDGDYFSLIKTIQKKEYGNEVLLPKTRKTNKTGLPFGFVKVTIHDE